MAKKITHQEMVQWFQDFEEATLDSRTEAEKHRDYYDGYQWTPNEIETLKHRMQPIVTFNRIAPKVDFVLGMEMTTRTDPRAYARNPGVDEDAAEAATDALRYIADVSGMDEEVSCAGNNLMVEGVCGGEVYLETYPNGETDIKIRYIPWDRLFWDPHSRFNDFRDAKYMGIVVWMDKDDAISMYPGSEDLFAFDDTSLGETFDDRPTTFSWYQGNSKRARVKICQAYYQCYDDASQRPQWYHCIFTKTGYLVDPHISPYLDEYGDTLCPIVLRSAKIDRQNQRYGMVKHLISPQDEVNKRRSKALHILNNRQTMSEKGALDNVREAKQELAKPDGHIVINPGMRFDILPTQDMAQGQMQLLQEAKAEMDTVSVSQALAGREMRVMSGRALQSRQQAGMIELQPFFDALRGWKLRLYRVAWSMVKQFWTYERWFRITDREDKPKYVGLNQPVRMADMVAQSGIDLNALLQSGQMTPEMEERLMEVVGVTNDVARMDVDIVLDESPDAVSLQAEQFEQLAVMASNGVPIPPDVLIEASSLRNKKQLLAMLRPDPESPEQQMQAQIAQMQQQLQMQDAQLSVEKKAAEVGKLKAETIESLSESRQRDAKAFEAVAKGRKNDIDADVERMRARLGLSFAPHSNRK